MITVPRLSLIPSSSTQVRRAPANEPGIQHRPQQISNETCRKGHSSLAHRPLEKRCPRRVAIRALAQARSRFRCPGPCRAVANRAPATWPGSCFFCSNQDHPPSGFLQRCLPLIREQGHPDSYELVCDGWARSCRSTASRSASGNGRNRRTRDWGSDHPSSARWAGR